MSELLEQPTTKQIHVSHGLPREDDLAVMQARNQLCQAVRQHTDYFVSIDGPCPLTNNPELTEQEAAQKVANAGSLAGYIALDRECFYKPRTNPDAWHGLDSSERLSAYKIVTNLAQRHQNVAAEIGSLQQLKRYGHALTMIWTGGRNVDNNELIEELALADRSLVIAVKNGLDGRIEPALHQIARIDYLRDGEGAPAILAYRGGKNAHSPRASQDAYKRAHEATDGKLFYDTAHGVEMAYDPKKKFEKSVLGQIRASKALVELSQQGYAPFGKLSEASDIDAVIDPHMPLETALGHSRLIHAAKLSHLTSNVRVE